MPDFLRGTVEINGDSIVFYQYVLNWYKNKSQDSSLDTIKLCAMYEKDSIVKYCKCIDSFMLESAKYGDDTNIITDRREVRVSVYKQGKCETKDWCYYKDAQFPDRFFMFSDFLWKTIYTFRKDGVITFE